MTRQKFKGWLKEKQPENIKDIKEEQPENIPRPTFFPSTLF